MFEKLGLRLENHPQLNATWKKTRPEISNLQKKKLKLNSVALVRERTIPTERPPLVDKVSANFCG
jgi:hypothetical protein